MHILLFDVDGTLVRTGKVVRRAFLQAIEETYGVRPDLEGYSFGGKTDPQIVRELMGRAGICAARVLDGRAGCLARYLDLLAAMLPQEGAGNVMPGVVPLLERCRRRTDALLALLTGNLERGARLKLEPLGLWRYFAFGGFSDRSEERAEIARWAVDEARRRAGGAFRPDRVTIIGDTEHDIDCARAVGARSVCVATGTRSMEWLRGRRPDWLLPDFTDAAAVNAALGM